VPTTKNARRARWTALLVLLSIEGADHAGALGSPAALQAAIDFLVAVPRT